MSRAAFIVRQLLESSYDIDDPLDRNDPAFYPEGFEARRANGDRRVFKLSLSDSNAARAVYKMTVHWTDDYTGKERVLDTAGLNTVPAENVEAWLAKQMVEWESGGWDVRPL